MRTVKGRTPLPRVTWAVVPWRGARIGVGVLSGACGDVGGPWLGAGGLGAPWRRGRAARGRPGAPPPPGPDRLLRGHWGGRATRRAAPPGGDGGPGTGAGAAARPDHGGPGARGPRAGDLPALRAPPHGLPAGAGDPSEGAVRVRGLLRAWEVDRPLDHGVVGRRSVDPARPADRRRAARGVRPRLRPLRPAPGAVPERCRGVARVARR